MFTLGSTLRVIVALFIVVWLSVASYLDYMHTQTQPETGQTQTPTVNLKQQPAEPVQKQAVMSSSSPAETVSTTSPQETEALTQNTSASTETATEPTPAVTQQELPDGTLFSDANSRARSSVVNIVCTTKTPRVTRTITGSGVVIDGRGVILTNAHIAQFFLLVPSTSGGTTACTVRTGNPAADHYRAELLYIPISWVEAHAHSIVEQSPTGTGEGDYAFLRITEPADDTSSLPDSFAYLPLDAHEEVVPQDTNVLVVSYPSLLSNLKEVEDKLYLVSTVTTTGTLFTFGDNTLDLFAVRGNIAAHRGSSGGAVVSPEGRLVGLIVTSTDDPLALNRELRALTPAYINRSLTKENGTSIARFLSGDMEKRARAFNLITAPILTDILVKQLKDVAASGN